MMVSIIFIGLVMAILFTPGPTNTLLASSAIQVGLYKSIRLIPAEALGYLVAISVWGLLIGSVSKHLPVLPIILKLFSAAYILYLALKLWRSANETTVLAQPTIRTHVLFTATLLNPKALLFASAVFPAMAWQRLEIYTAHMLVFLLLIIPIACVWIALGALLSSGRIVWLSQKNLQKTASLVLMSFSIPMSYSAILSL